MYTVNYFVKMLILDTWYNKFHCNIEIEANRPRMRLIKESMGNKEQRFWKEDSGESFSTGAVCYYIYNERTLFSQYLFYL